jgi:hypothetical protein
MTISTEDNSEQYSTNGVTTVFSVPYYFIQNADLLVTYTNAAGVETTLTLGSDYTVSGAGNPSGGSITTATAYATGGLITIDNEPAALQPIDYTETDPFPAATHETGLDRAILVSQRALRLGKRALKLPLSDTSNTTLPKASERASRALGFDASGNLTTFATSATDFSLPTGASDVGADDGASGTLWTTVQGFINKIISSVGSDIVGYLPEGSNSIPGTVQKELRGNVFAGSAGALFDGVTDDTDAINKVTLDLATRSPTGGVIKFPSGKVAKINGPLYITSNIRLDLNGCALVGQGNTVGNMFETAYISGGEFVTNVGTAYESHVTRNAKIYNGYVYNVGKMCNFQNFNHGCQVKDIELYNARQFGVFDACFYSKFDVITHIGGTEISLPSFHFKSANNSIKLTKVITTCEYDYLFEGGSTVVTLDECSTEGGTIGIKVKGDMIGLNIKGHYAEALIKFLDLSEAGVVKFDVSGNYFNYVDVVLDDGGSTTGGPEISGNWDETNAIVNIGGVVGPTTYRGRMQVSAQQNLARYYIPNNSGFGITSLPANWITSKNTNIEFISTVTATSISDYRQKTKVPGTSLIAPYRVGDTGAVYPGSVFFTTVTIGATSTIDTKIAWQPNSLFAKFAFTAQDGNGNHVIYGDIYGANFKRHDADAMVMAISDNAGFLRISLTQTVATFVSVTGSVQICS